MTAELPAAAELELFLSSWVAQHGDGDYLLDAIVPEGGYVPLAISGLRAIVADLRHARADAERLRTALHASPSAGHYPVEAAAAVAAFLDILAPTRPDVIERVWADRAYELRISGLRALLAAVAASAAG